MAYKVLNINAYSPFKRRSGLTGKYHAICHYSYNLPLCTDRMRHRLLISSVLIISCFSCFSQSPWPKSEYIKDKEREIRVLPYQTNSNQKAKEIRKLRLPVWSFHEHNVNIYGVSIGAFSYENDYRNTVSNGVRLELPGVGMFALTGFMNAPPNAKVDSLRRGF